MLLWHQILALLVWLPVGVWVYTVIGWLVMDEVEPPIGWAALVVGIGLGLATSLAPSRELCWVPFSVAVITVVLAPGVMEAWRRYEMFRIDVEKADGIYERLRVNRGDVYAMTKLSEVLYERGVIHPAIALLDGALKGQPQELFQNEMKILGRWRRDLGSLPLRTEVACPRCGTINGAGVFCQRCGGEFLLDLMRRRSVGFGGWGFVMGVWLVLAGLVAAGPFLLTDTVGPEVRLGAGILAMLVALGALGAFVWRGVKG